MATELDKTIFTPEDFGIASSSLNTSDPAIFREEDFAVKTEDDYLTEDSFLADAKLLADYLPVLPPDGGGASYMESIQGQPVVGGRQIGLDEMQAGMEAARESYAPSDLEYTKGMMDAIGQIQWNLPDLGLTAMGVSDWPEEAQMALIRTMQIYDDVPTEARHYLRAAEGIASDPSTYIGFGFFAQALKNIALKGGAVSLIKSLVSKPVLGATAVAAIEGGAYTAADDFARQGIENKGDFSKTDTTRLAKATGVGTGFGGGIGFFLSKVLGPSVVKKVTNEPDNLLDAPTDAVDVDTLEALPQTTDIDVDSLEALPQSNDIDVDALEDLPQLDDIVNTPVDLPPAVVDEPLSGELLDDGTGTNVSTNAQRGALDEGIEQPVNGDVDSLDNAEVIGESGIGEDWRHMYEGEQTFNTDRLETLDDVKAFIESSSAHWENVRLRDVDGNPDGVETLESARAKASDEAEKLKEETGGDISEILEQYKDDNVELQKIRHRTQALRQLNLSLGERVLELAEKQKHGGGLLHEEAAEFVEKTGLFANTMELTKLASREFSRGLGNYRMIMKGDPTLMEGLRTGQAFGDIGTLAETILSMTSAGKGKINLKGLKEATNKIKDPTFLDEVIRLRSAMMLSGPSTIEAAGLSNMAKLWTEPFVEWVGHLGRGSAKKKARVRAIAQYAGNRRFFFSSWKQAAKAWKNGQHITDPFITKVENQTDNSLANMSWARRNLYERGVNFAHLALLFLDEGIKSNRARSLIYADTFSEAAEQGLATKGDAFEALLQKNLDAKIDKNGMLRDAEILREIRETTYTSDLEGTVGKAVTAIANLGGGWGRLIAVPFIRAPINIVSESLMYIPGTKIFSAKQKNIMTKGSPIAKAKLKARKQLGTAAVLGIYYAAEEDLITGSGPADYKLRADWKAMGYEPNSIRVGDEWVSYAKLGPIGLLIGLVADVNWITKKDLSGTNVVDATSEVLAASIFAVTNNVLNKAYFSSVSGLMDGLQSPDTLGTKLQSWFLSFTPNVLNQMNSDLELKEATSMMEKLQRRIPIWSESLGNQYDLYGRVITKPAHDIPVYGYMFKNREIVKDAVAEEVYQLGNGLDKAILAKPSYALGVTNTDFREVYDYGESESVYAKYNRIIGETRDPNTGLDLHSALESFINSPDYRLLPNSTLGDITPPKVAVIKKIVNGYRRMALVELSRISPAYTQEQNARFERIEDIFQ